MGIPAPSGIAATGAPAANDQANAVLTGSIAAKGPTEPFAFRGPMNLLLWSDVVTTLTTTAGSLTASVASATGLAIGNAINSVNLPNGATIGNLVSTTVTLALPPNATASQVLNGADANASFTGGLITWNATLQLETSFDGCATWLVCNIGLTGTLAQWTSGPINLTFGQPEKQVYYRFNCIAFTSGPINYRISQTGGAAESLAIGPLSGG